ncbi:MAG: 23S rRNA (uracil(1939)-C(5))-methyltransferase RlmD [Candidatus Gastranaerophilales bacterium]|nr:23S rRNA (uracil(1939)-C(5))-methyltransferase RlmD [Candidatus Gastranaerophilales bacterium]
MENELIVEIEKLSSDGKGIVRHNGIVIFVDKTCPQDKCKIKIIKRNKSYYIGEVVEIIEKSPNRVKPFCPMQNICGACQLQFIDYNYQLQLKKQIVEDSMRGIETQILDIVPSPQNREYRHKIQYPIRQTQVSKRILAGYFKPKSHDIVNIKYCPIQPAICDEIIEYIRENAPKYGIEGYDENKNKGLLKHVVIRSSTYNDTNLVVLVLNANKAPERIKDFAQKLYDKFDKITGITANFNNKPTNLIMTNDTILLYGKDYIEEKICDVIFKVGSNTFFQVNPKSAENIFKYVKNYIQTNFDKPKVLDAYAGISAFGLVVAKDCSAVVSVEENKASVELAKEVKKLNGINNINLYNEDSAKFFEQELQKSEKTFDITILDPPRKGCSEESLEYTLKLTKSKIIYVSCNPATLARDLKYLINKGCTVESIKPFDMFCHTYHVENVAIISV